MPTSAVICRPWTSESRSPVGSKPNGSMSFMAAAMIRRPCSPSRSIAWSARWFSCSPQGTVSPLARAVVDRPITAGAAPLTKTRTTGFPDSSLASQKAAMSLYVGSNGRVASRGYAACVPSMSSFALCPRTSRAPSVGSPTTLPSTSLASLVIRNGRIAASIVFVLPAAWCTSPSRP